MWTPTTRAQHSRAGLRYGIDVTDAKWLILSPFLPAPCAVAARAIGRCGRSSTRSSMSCAAGVPGAFCRKTSRPRPRRIADSPGFATIAPGSGYPALLHRPTRTTHARAAARGARNRTVPAHRLPRHPARDPRNPRLLDAETPQAGPPSSLIRGASLASVTPFQGFNAAQRAGFRIKRAQILARGYQRRASSHRPTQRRSA